MWKSLVGSIALVCVARSAAAADFYVTEAGAGSGSGKSAANAWSLAQFNGASAPGAGDVVHFAGKFSSTVSPQSGGSGDGAKRLTLSFAEATLGGDPGLEVVGQGNLNLEGGTIEGPNTTGISFGGQASHDVTVSGWKLTGADDDTGLFIAANYCTNLVVIDNTVTSAGGFLFGDSTQNHDLRIANNLVTTSHDVTNETDIIKIGDAFQVTIEGNKLVQRTTGDNASGRHNDCIQTYRKGGSNPGNAHGWTIRFNWIELDVQGGTGDTSWLMLENMASPGGADAAAIYGNVFVGAATDDGSNNGIAPNSNEAGAVFRLYNNTIVRKNGPDNTVRFLAPGTLDAANNAGWAVEGASGTFLSWSMDPGEPWDHNWFFRFDAAPNTTGPHGGTSDPMFTDVEGGDFGLAASSPLRGAGDASIGETYALGLKPGTLWPNPALVPRPAADWDIGAYQHCEGSCLVGDAGGGGSTASAGGTGGEGAGGPHGSGGDGGGGPSEGSDSGCGCRVVDGRFTAAPASPGWMAGLPGLMVLALFGLRRRRG